MALSQGKNHKRLQTILFSPLSTEGSGSPESFSVCGRSRMLNLKLCRFDRQYFHKMMRNHQKLTFVNAHSNYFLKNSDQNFMKSKPFSLISPEIVNLCFSQSALRIVASRLCRFPVLMAGSCCPASLAIGSALYRLSDACLIRKTGTSNYFSSYCTVEKKSQCFPAELRSCKKPQLYRMLSSYVLRAIRSISGFPLAL